MTIFIVHNDNDKPSALIDYGGYKSSSSTESLNLAKDDIVIQWGEGQRSIETSTGWVLNSVEGLINCSDQSWRDLLKIHGLHIASHGQQFQKKYVVFVFQLGVLGLYSEQGDVWLSNATKTRGRYREISLAKNNIEYRKVKKLAIRSIHALGLDFGMVTIGVINKEQYVIQVSPKPMLFKNMIIRLTKAIQTLEQQLLKPSDPTNIILGADPEFVLRKSNGKFILASTFFTKSGSVGCDQIWLKGDKTRKKLPIVELRPIPSTEPRRLVRNIYARLLAANKKINDSDIQFLAGSHPLKGYPIGGHIHFSKINLNSFFLRALDNYLALPLFILEDPSGFSRRPKYGFVGDYREQFHGGFEYRSLPSWLVSPKVTKGVVALAKLIASSYPKLRKIPLSRPSVQYAYYNGDQTTIFNVVQSLWEDIEKQAMYDTYRSWLDPLKDSIFKQERWDETADIRSRWRIPPYN